jgi:hypothetical protein
MGSAAVPPYSGIENRESDVPTRAVGGKATCPTVHQDDEAW